MSLAPLQLDANAKRTTAMAVAKQVDRDQGRKFPDASATILPLLTLGFV
jgi:hypothetical protein